MVIKTRLPSATLPKKTSTEKPGQFFPMLSVPFSREANRTYFTMILPLGSSVPCTRTRLPSNLATSVWWSMS